jgi:hypothetical protein
LCGKFLLRVAGNFCGERWLAGNLLASVVAVAGWLRARIKRASEIRNVAIDDQLYGSWYL